MLLSVVALNTACIVVFSDPPRDTQLNVTTEDGHPIDRFAFVRLVESERFHAFEDPQRHNYFQPPKVTHALLFAEGRAVLREPRQTRIVSIVFIPFLGFSAQTDVFYRIYAEGYDVWRRPSESELYELALGLHQNSNEGARCDKPRTSPTRTTFTLRPAVDTPLGPEVLAMIRPGISDECAGTAGVIGDLRDVAYWNQLHAFAGKPESRAAVAYIAHYYRDRLNRVKAVDPLWRVPDGCESALKVIDELLGDVESADRP